MFTKDVITSNECDSKGEELFVKNTLCFFRCSYPSFSEPELPTEMKIAKDFARNDLAHGLRKGYGVGPFRKAYCKKTWKGTLEKG